MRLNEDHRSKGAGPGEKVATGVSHPAEHTFETGDLSHLERVPHGPMAGRPSPALLTLELGGQLRVPPLLPRPSTGSPFRP